MDTGLASCSDTRSVIAPSSAPPSLTGAPPPRPQRVLRAQKHPALWRGWGAALGRGQERNRKAGRPTPASARAPRVPPPRG